MQGLEAFDIVLPATVAGLAIALIHSVLGIEVLRRGIIFIDLAIAQIAGLCVVLTALLLHEPSWSQTQIAAGIAALAAAAFFRWVERVVPDEQEAIIGSCFILAASAVLLALADHPQGGEEIQHILSGQILFISWSEILAFLPLYAAALAIWFSVPRARSGLGFFVLFAIGRYGVRAACGGLRRLCQPDPAGAGREHDEQSQDRGGDDLGRTGGSDRYYRCSVARPSGGPRHGVFVRDYRSVLPAGI